MSEIKRYAFIDASNIIGTTIELLNFRIDWLKLIMHLKGEKWSCESVFYYQGRLNRLDQDRKFEKLNDIGYVTRTKLTHIHKDKINDHIFRCGHCGVDAFVKITTPGHRKSNCDVELTVDACELSGVDKEFLIFTGDGDFAYLIEKLISKGTLVRIISNTGMNEKGNRSFSTRLKAIICREEKDQKRVSFIDINDWKMKIIKEEIKKPPTSVTASELPLNNNAD